MGVGVSRALLDRSRMTIRVAAIHVSRWARTSTAMTVCCALAAMQAVSPSPIALDASCVCRKVQPMCQPLGTLALPVRRVQSRMLHAPAAPAVHLDRTTRFGIAQMAVPANDAIQGQSPTQPALLASLALLRTRRTAASVWSVMLAKGLHRTPQDAKCARVWTSLNVASAQHAYLLLL